MCTLSWVNSEDVCIFIANEKAILEGIRCQFSTFSLWLWEQNWRKNPPTNSVGKWGPALSWHCSPISSPSKKEMFAHISSSKSDMLCQCDGSRAVTAFWNIIHSSHISVQGTGSKVGVGGGPWKMKGFGPLEDLGVEITNQMCWGRCVKIRVLHLIMFSPPHHSSTRQLFCPLNNSWATRWPLPGIIIVICTYVVHVWCCLTDHRVLEGRSGSLAILAFPTVPCATRTPYLSTDERMNEWS